MKATTLLTASWAAAAATLSTVSARPASQGLDARSSSNDLPPVLWPEDRPSANISVSEAPLSELHTLTKRSRVNALTSCRSAINSDFGGLNDYQLSLFMANINKVFSADLPVYKAVGPRVVRNAFYNPASSLTGQNARVSVLRSEDIVQNGQNPASICMDGAMAKTEIDASQSTCSDNTIKVYGKTASAGSTVAVL